MAEPTRTAREFKRRLGDPTADSSAARPTARRRSWRTCCARSWTRSRARGRAAGGHRPHPPRELRPVQALAARRGGEAGRGRGGRAPDRARGGGDRLRASRTGGAGRGRRGLRLRGRHVRRRRPAQDRRPGSSSSAVPRASSGSAGSTSTRPSSPTSRPSLGRPAGRARRERSGHAGALARLREECRRAKEPSSADTDTTIPIFLPGIQTEMRLTRAELEEMVRPRIRETIEALGGRSAARPPRRRLAVLLVGGSSSHPARAEMVREATGRPVAVDAHPKLAVSLGAARFGLERLDLSGNPVAVPVPGPVPAEEPAPVPADQPAPVPADQPAPVMAAVAAISTRASGPQSTAAVRPRPRRQ